MELDAEKKSVKEIVEEYRVTVEALAKYLPWLESKSGQNLMSQYVPENSSTVAIPTYDSTLLSFIKAVENTGRINRNYDYVYKRYKIYGDMDEISLTHRAGIQDMEMLFAILSKYVINGRVKGIVWKTGVENGVYYEVVKKMKELVEFWTMPM